jgi:hypothetical protein
MYIKTKDRPCKECGENKRLPGISLCRECKRIDDLVKWSLKKVRDKKKKQKEKLKRMKYRVKNSRQKVEKRVEEKFRKYIRLKLSDKYGNGRCYTCGKIKHYKNANAGHFIHNKLDFDERNYKFQCIHCNDHLSGNLSVYKSHLIKDYGIEWVDKLEKDSRKKHIYSVSELLIMEKEIDKNIKDLLSKKIEYN